MHCFPEANNKLTCEQIEPQREDPGKFLHPHWNSIEGIEYAAKTAKESGTRVILNPALLAIRYVITWLRQTKPKWSVDGRYRNLLVRLLRKVSRQ